MIQAFLTDDHTLFVEGITACLNASGRVSITRSFGSIGDCRKALASELPDVLLLDLSMPDGDGVEFCREMTEAHPELKIIALTVHDECSVVKRAMENGAKGYVLKSASSAELIEAIEQVNMGETYLCREIVTLQRRNATNAVYLTAREREILKLLVEGHNSDQIASMLYISPLTVKWHRQNLLVKFDAQNTSTLIARAIKERLV